MKIKIQTIALCSITIGLMPLYFVPETEGAKKRTKDKKVASNNTLFGFSSNNSGEQWIVVNDNVMGGRSKGSFSFKKDKLIFSGSTNTNGGGFSSIRTKPVDLDLDKKDGLVLRFKGDGRTYMCGVNMELSKASYRMDFDTDKDAKGWQVAKIPFSSMSASWRGMPLSKERYPLKKDKIRSVTLMIYDKNDGPFYLKIDSIKTYSDEK